MRHIIRDEKAVHDKVTFCAGDEKLTLRVDKSGRQMIADLNKAREQMQKISPESLEEEMEGCARAFAEAIFGPEQAEKLLRLYNNPSSTVNVCGQYFQKYLKNKITRAQIK